MVCHVKYAGFTTEYLDSNRFLGLPKQMSFIILLQRGIADPFCEAAALSGRFLPELGRFGLPKRPFSFGQTRFQRRNQH